MFLFTVFLFVLLTPAILVRLPPKGSKLTVAIVHGLIFSIILHLSHRFVLGLAFNIEGATGSMATDTSYNSAKATKRSTTATTANDKYASTTTK